MSTERTLPKSTITEQRNDGSVGMKYKPLELIGSGGFGDCLFRSSTGCQ